MHVLGHHHAGGRGRVYTSHLNLVSTLVSRLGHQLEHDCVSEKSHFHEVVVPVSFASCCFSEKQTFYVRAFPPEMAGNADFGDTGNDTYWYELDGELEVDAASYGSSLDLSEGEGGEGGESGGEGSEGSSGDDEDEDDDAEPAWEETNADIDVPVFTPLSLNQKIKTL